MLDSRPSVFSAMDQSENGWTEVAHADITDTYV